MTTQQIAHFRDSSSLLGDADAIKTRFDEDGLVFFRGLLDRDKVLNVRRDILTALSKLGWTKAGTDPMDGVPDDLIRREADPNWWGGYAAINSEFSFHELAHDAALLEPLKTFLGDEILVHPRKICRVTYPNSEYPTPPHQDFPLIQGTTDVFTVWVPFGDVPIVQGGLRVLRQSPFEGQMQLVPREGIAGVGVAVEDDDPRWATIDYRAGDALMLHAFSVHWGPPNRGTSMRLSADYRYQALREPVVQGSLGPHGHPAIPGWDELTKGWSQTWPIDTPDGVNIVDMANPFEAKAPKSRLIHTD